MIVNSYFLSKSAAARMTRRQFASLRPGERTLVEVKIPATSANMGSGFDSLGMAIDMWNYVTVERGADHSFEMVISVDRRNVSSSSSHKLVSFLRIHH